MVDIKLAVSYFLFAPPPQTLHENLGTTLIIDTLCGYNSTLVAAGATGSCKSLTMFGPHKIRNRTTKEYDAGLVPWMFGQIVEAARARQALTAETSPEFTAHTSASAEDDITDGPLLPRLVF